MKVRNTSFGIAVGLAAGLLVAVSSPRVAAAADASQVSVTFADLDLLRAEGVAVLYQRIQAAARTVCGFYEGRTIESHAKFENCKLSAIHDAVVDVAVPALVDYFKERNGKTDSSTTDRKEVVVASRASARPRLLCLAEINEVEPLVPVVTLLHF